MVWLTWLKLWKDPQKWIIVMGNENKGLFQYIGANRALTLSLINKEKEHVMRHHELAAQWLNDWANYLHWYAYHFSISFAWLLSTSIVWVINFSPQYVEMNDEEMDSKAGLIALEAARISQFYSLLTSSIDVIFKFCDKIPGFNDLCKQDRELLFRSACLELFTLRLSHRFYYIF